jgi:hypothetical protein
MLTNELAKPVAYRKQVAEKLGYDFKKLDTVKFEPLSDAKKASLLNAPIAALTVPIHLSPSRLINGQSNLELFSSMMVDPANPAGSGMALFSSAYPGVLFPTAQVAFPRIAKGKMHLVEFHVELYSNVTYHFRVFQYPLGDFQDISVQGPKTETLVALVQPVDQIEGNLELGASIDQHNTLNDDAGWSLHSVSITTTS